MTQQTRDLIPEMWALRDEMKKRTIEEKNPAKLAALGILTGFLEDVTPRMALVVDGQHDLVLDNEIEQFKAAMREAKGNG